MGVKVKRVKDLPAGRNEFQMRAFRANFLMAAGYEAARMFLCR